MNEFLKLIRENYNHMYNSDYDVKPETNIISDMQYDSLSFISLMAEVEEYYNIEIILDDLVKLSKIEDFYLFICSIKGGK